MAASVRIFVSHRNDLKAVTVNNEIYCNMMCGAVYYSGDKYIEGDDTLDNISNQKPYMSELTVQYWAWKNCDSDYIGLCHYRRFLSFNDSKVFPHTKRNITESLFLNDKTMRRYGFDNPYHIREIIESYDAIVNYPFDTRYIETPMGKVDTVYDLWYAHSIIFIDAYALKILPEIVKEKEPEYYDSLMEYFQGVSQRGYNCFVLKKELFRELNRFQFNIVEELNRRIPIESYNEKYCRTPAYICEILYGVYILYLQKKKYKIKELQLVFFSHPEIPDQSIKGSVKRLGYRIKNINRVILPDGTKRREFVKKMYYSVFRKKRK